MSEIIRIAVSDIMPSPESILCGQGIVAGADIRPRIGDAVDAALTLFSELAEPRAIIKEIDRSEFEPIYFGMGYNDSPGPIEQIYIQAENLALFAATVGGAISVKISKLFANNDFVLGNFLDAAASEGADRISQRLEMRFKDSLIEREPAAVATTVLAYSPGYCGWHISAQRKLFDTLCPERIGIALRDSFLMDPLKSISGILVSGPKKIHEFDGTYPFCEQCRSQPCRGRKQVSQG